MHHKRISLVGVACCILLSCSALGGKLGDFEDDATKKRSRHRHEDYDSEPSFLSELISDVLFDVSEDTLAQSLDPRLELLPLPMARLDASYQNVESDVEAWDFRAEGGYQMLALRYDHTHYKEADPDDTLNLVRVHGMLRMRTSEEFSGGLGLGVLVIDGDERHTGASFLMAMALQPNEHLAMELKAAWASVNGVSNTDYDVAFLLGWRYAWVKAGYRWVESPHESLNGPYVGLSLQAW